MSADLKLRVITDGDTRGLDKTARSLDELAADADHAGKSTKGLGEEADKTSKKTEGLGRKSRQARQDIVDLDKRIIELKKSLKTLGDEFDKTGKLNLSKFRADSRELSGLERMKKQIEGLKTETAHWSDSLQAAFGTVGGLLQKVPMLGSPGGLAAGAALAVPVGAAVGGATLAAGGVAGAGIAAAAGFAGDPAKVGAAWTSEIDHIKAKWAEVGKVAVDPTIAAIKVLGDTFDHINFDRIVGKGAQYLEPIAKAAGSALTYIASGVETLIDNAGPEMAVLAKEVPEVGRAIKEALEAISSQSDGGARALTDLFHVVEGLIVGTGNFVGGLEAIYGALGDASDQTREWVDNINPLVAKIHELQGGGEVLAYQFRETSQAAGDATYTFNGLAVELYNTRDAADAANNAFERLFGEAMNLDQANLAVKEGMIQLRGELEKNGDTLSSNTQKGIDNQQAILGQIERLDHLRESAIASGNGTKEATDAANAAFASQVEALRRVLIQMGFNKQAVDELIAKYLQIPKEISTDVNTYYHNYYTSPNSPIGPEERKYGPRGHARGTPSAPSGWAWVGEEGPELVNFRGGERVLDNPTSMRMASAGSAAMNVTLSVMPGADDKVAELINYLARANLLQIKASAVVS